MRLPVPIARLPLRWRLTLACTAVIGVLLLAVGIVLFFRFKAGLDDGLDAALRNRAAEVMSVTQDRPTAAARRVVDSGEEYVQVLSPSGEIVVGSARTVTKPLLSAAEQRRARQGPVFIDRGEHDRVLGEPLSDRPGYVVAVGASLDQREDALEQLGATLTIGFTIAVLLAAATAYAVATGALRPVELMRRRAHSISAADPEARLPLPAAEDELHRLGTTLNEMLERLQLAVERERSFVSDASHQLRTPLAVLKAEIDVALRGPGEAAALREALVNAGAETDRLIALAEDLLVLAREDQGGLPLDRRVADVDDLLEGVARRFAQRAQASDRAITVAAPPAMTLRADTRWLEQALGNLVDNALRHGDGDIHLEAVASDGVLELHVRDSGAGFPASFLPLAFERFTRAAAGRSGDGTGLGLAIVRAVARAHDGRADAASGPDGTDVWITVPAP